LIELEQYKSYVVIPVKAFPGSRRSELRGVQNGQLRVAVTQVAEKGKANKAIIALLAKKLELRKSQIELLSGSTSSKKRFAVSAVSLDELKIRICSNSR